MSVISVVKKEEKSRLVKWKSRKYVTNCISHASPPVNFDIPIPDRQCIRLVLERHPSRRLPSHGLRGVELGLCNAAKTNLNLLPPCFSR